MSGSSARTTSDDRPAWRRWSVVLPAVTFLLGLLLGAVVVAASGDDEQQAASVPPPAAPTPTAEGQLTVRVPAPCLRAADEAEQAYAVLEQGVAAARDLDARRLQELVDTVQRERPEAEALVRACREQAGAALASPAPSTAGAPSPTGP